MWKRLLMATIWRSFAAARKPTTGQVLFPAREKLLPPVKSKEELKNMIKRSLGTYSGLAKMYEYNKPSIDDEVLNAMVKKASRIYQLTLREETKQSAEAIFRKTLAPLLHKIHTDIQTGKIRLNDSCDILIALQPILYANQKLPYAPSLIKVRKPH